MNEFHYTGVDNLDVMTFAHNYNKAILRFIVPGIRKSDKILEFGTGKGEFCNRLAENYYIDGVEIDKNFHQYLKTKRKYCGLNEVNTTYDLIYSINVLEHIEDHKCVMNSLYNLLNVKGRLKVFVPARKELFTQMDTKVGHLRRYSIKDIKELLLLTGFKIQRISYFDFLGYFATLVYKYLPQKKEGKITTTPIIFYDKFVFPLSHFIDNLSKGKIIGKNILIEAIKT